MTEYANELVGRKIQIKDMNTGKLIASTRITAFDSAKKTVKISASGLSSPGCREVSVLIFGAHRLLEYYGNMNKPVIANELEIDLYSGRVREDRKRLRYDIKAPGKVTGIQIAGKRITLRKPIEITTKNISANGLLIESEAGSFEKGDRILIRLDLGETTLRGMYEVVRIQNQNLWTEEYGCRHIAMGKNRENYDRRKKEHYIKKGSDPVPVGWHGTFRRSV